MTIDSKSTGSRAMMDYSEPRIMVQQALKLLDQYLLKNDFDSAYACAQEAQKRLEDVMAAIKSMQG